MSILAIILLLSLIVIGIVGSLVIVQRDWNFYRVLIAFMVFIGVILSLMTLIIMYVQ